MNCFCVQFQRLSCTQDIETGVISGPKRNILTAFFSAIFIEAFVLTFLAEWGDRSQIATIVLAAREVRNSQADILHDTFAFIQNCFYLKLPWGILLIHILIVIR